MFGYVIPDKNNMYVKDFNVFQAYYCGLCKALSRSGSQPTRLCTNYDTTFYNALLHSLTDTEPVFERKICLYNGKKKPMIKTDALTAKVADLSVLLVYYNALDDVHDGRKSRAAVVGALAARKRAAARRMPEVDAMMKESFRKLSVLEKRGCADIDLVADCFASLMRDVTRRLIPADGHTDTFMYNLGRLVYLFDAVDDVEKDGKKGRYNPLIAAYGKCGTKAEFLENNAQELDFLLRSTYNRLVGAYNSMHIVVSEGVLSNTVYRGLRIQMERLLKGDDKCQMTRL